MLHKEDFCEHFCEKSDKEIVEDIRKSIASFMKQREEGEDFGAKMVHKAKLRIDAVHDVRSDAGKQGGRPRKDTTADAPTREDGEFKSGSGNAVNLESATPAKPSLAYAGKNGLVRLTDDEYNILLAEMGNKRDADRLIDSLDYVLAEGRTYQQPHLHVLTHWKDYRDEKKAEAAEVAKVSAEARAEANKKHGYKTHADKMDEMMEGAKHLIQMYSLPEVKNG